jgi:inner membrane protein
MASIGHLAVALAARRFSGAPRRIPPWAWAWLLAILSFLPDADVLGFWLGVPYGAPFGHRGALHSLAFAAFVASVLGGVSAWLGLPAMRVALTGGLVLATHGLLDALTDGGRGVALLWPLSNERYFAFWRPLAVAPIGRAILSADGLGLMAHEAMWFLPFWAVAAWPIRRPEGEGALEHERGA